MNRYYQPIPASDPRGGTNYKCSNCGYRLTAHAPNCQDGRAWKNHSPDAAYIDACECCGREFAAHILECPEEPYKPVKIGLIVGR